MSRSESFLLGCLLTCILAISLILIKEHSNPIPDCKEPCKLMCICVEDEK